MSKQYKLKEWYPSLHEQVEEGDIAKLEKSRCGDKYVIKLDPPKCVQWLDKDEVENNPKFWEKVEEKNYKILKFKSQGKVFEIDEDQFSSHKSLMNYIENFNASIYSVKRLSDGKVFTVGDEIKCEHFVPMGEVREIVGFEMKDFLSDDRKTLHVHQTGGWSKLSEIDKVNYVFTTEDGVDIYEGDSYVIVGRNELWINKKKKATKISGRKNESYLYFSTVDKAKEYVDLHKPVYSKKDILNAIDKVLKGDPLYVERDHLKEELNI